MKIARFSRFPTLLIAVLVATGTGMAQSAGEANAAFERGDFLSAIEHYKALVAEFPDDEEYNRRLGLSYLRTNVNPKQALPHLLRAEELTKKPRGLYLDIARALSFHLEYDRALSYLDEFERTGKIKKRDAGPYEKMRLDYLAAGDLLKYPIDLTFRNLGEAVNSAFPDYNPFVTRDGKTLFFTSRRQMRPGDRPEFDGYYPSDIYVYDLQNPDLKARRLNEPVNTPYDEQIVGLTDTGDSLFVYIDHVSNFGDVHVSVKSGTMYRRPRPLEDGVNSPGIESACTISADGNTIIFSSNRPGGSGGMDLWRITKQADGNWSLPENLGPQINTPFDEDYPNLSGDGRTLFFTSNGHPGMGGFDLYFSGLDPETGKWTVPQNLGYPLNTPLDDKTISFARKSDVAFITAVRREGLGDMDVYEVTFNEAITASDPAIFLVNIPAITDPSEAPEITVSDDTDNLVGRYFPHRFTNRYVFALYPGKYILRVSAPGFDPYEEVLVVNHTHLRLDQNVRIINLKRK